MRRALSLTLVLLLVGCGGDDPAADDGTGPSITMQDAKAPEPPVVGAPTDWWVVRAVVEPSDISKVSWEVPGEVSEVLVAVGDSVRKGQTLGRLATDERKARLAQARMLYRRAHRSSPHAKEGGGPPPPALEDAVKRRLAQVRVAAKKAPGDRAAVQRAAKREGEEGARDLAILLATRRNKGGSASRRAGERAGEDALARAVLSELGTRVRNLEHAVNKSRVASPVSGFVLAVAAQPGRSWNTRDPEPAFQIVDPSLFVARVTLPAARARRFESEEEAWVELPSHVEAASRTVPAYVVSVSSRDVSIEDEDGIPGLWREVGFKLPTRLPGGLTIGDEVRVAFAP